MDVDIPFLGALYCILMIVVGQFFLMNLILAVIIFSFIKTQKQELESEIKALNDDETKHGGDNNNQSPNNTQNNEGSQTITENGGKQGDDGDRSLTSQILKGK